MTDQKKIKAVRKIGTGEVFAYSAELLKDPRYELYTGPAPKKSSRQILIDGAYHEVDEFGATTGVTAPFIPDEGEAKPVRKSLGEGNDFIAPANVDAVSAVPSAPSRFEVVEPPAQERPKRRVAPVAEPVAGPVTEPVTEQTTGQVTEPVTQSGFPAVSDVPNAFAPGGIDDLL